LKFLRSSFWLHSIFYTLLQRSSLFFFGVVSYIVLVRGLTKENNGVWALYLVVLTIFETVKQGLLRNPTIKFLGLSEYEFKKDDIQTASLAINILFSAIAIVLLLFFGGQLSQLLKSPELKPLLWWSVAMILLLIPFNHCEILLQANYQFPKIFWAYFIRQGIFFLGILILFFFSREYFTLLTLIKLQILALFCGVVVMYPPARKYLLKKFSLDTVIIMRLFHFGKFIFGTNLVSNLSRSFDHFITANVLGPVTGKSYVAYYNTVARINNMVDVPSLAAADVLFPKNVETFETDGLGKVKYYFERMVGTILALVIPISLFIFIFPGFIIYVLAGKNYYGAIPILQLTILFSLVRPLSYQFGSTLDAIGKPHINFWANFLLMIFNLVMTYLFLSFFDGIGAAYATVITYTVSFFTMIAILKKYIHVELLNICRYIFQSYKDVFRITSKALSGNYGS